ncbi:sigma-54 factor interaction domain-containing protein [Candidatus Pinguicoccus supinus]|uniref:Sigma-54 factor interaction domain-containing protein n=1 Tax=Candidatus Pinguicoccus supinus TaxID=2529394 RepID=A0A7T0BRG4_9BACT|nr:sigma-54 factor interaction domain-containing protein [Candidatus Pinguicoccus supinus]
MCIENIFIEINNLKAYNLTLGIFKLLNFKKKYNTINLWLFSSNISTHLFILFANFKEFNVKIFYLKKPTSYIRFIKIIYSLDQLVVKRSTKDFLGKSLYIKILLKKILRISKSKVPILILGESGSGKELIAKTIHLHSLRGRSILNILNCSAIPKTLIESELFGYKQGSFTGAVFDKLGKLEISDKGTLFLDEIGELESSIQIKLLRFLETGEIYPIGGLYSTKIDIKLIFATNKNLNFLVNSGKFRIDFLFRINIVELMIPSLRNRKLDLICLLKIFLINKLNQVFIFKKNILKFLIMHS